MIFRGLALLSLLTILFAVAKPENAIGILDQSSDSFAACVLVMDDNHRLIEWLAFHYHTLPLRRVILMMDPRSKTSPATVLNRWKNYMDIDLWSDDDVFSEEELKQRTEEADDIRLHRSRQRAFNTECMLTLMSEGVSWTAMIDPDEYLYINPRAWDSSKSLYQEGIDVISIEEPGSVLKMLNKIDLTDDRMHAQEWQACLPVSRLQFSSLESSSDDVGRCFPKELEPSLLAQDFDTLRWRYHGIDQVTGVLPGKTMVNLSRIPQEHLWRLTGDPHIPIEKLCAFEDARLRNNETIFLANHVLGTLEHYASRDDSRFVDRAINWEKRKMIGSMISDDVRRWLPGFVKEMGVQETSRLLANVGKLEMKSSDLPAKSSDLPRCSLNFFGLPRSFRSLALPSIVKNILMSNVNYNCDIFVHYYKINQEAEGRFNRGGQIDADSVLALEEVTKVVAANAEQSPPSVIIVGETKEEFSEQYGNLVEQYQTARDPQTGELIYFPTADPSYTSTKQIENVLMQWNSIQSVWTEMEKQSNDLGIEYERVAFFRLDAFYALPVDIFQINKDTYDFSNRYAVVPGFAKYPVNDRMFYGPFEAAKIWATERFNRIEHHIATYEPKGFGIHSERYLEHEIIPAITTETSYEIIENNDICFYRTRSSDSLLISDCEDPNGGIANGIQDINQVHLVEDLLHRNCEEFPADSEGRFWELSCDSSTVSMFWIRNLENSTNSTNPTYVPTKAPSTSNPFSWDITMEKAEGGRNSNGMPIIEVFYESSDRDYQIEVFQDDCKTKTSILSEKHERTNSDQHGFMNVHVELTVSQDMLEDSLLWDEEASAFSFCMAKSLLASDSDSDSTVVTKRKTKFRVSISNQAGFSINVITVEAEEVENENISIMHDASINAYLCDEKFSEVEKNPLGPFDSLVVCVSVESEEDGVIVSGIRDFEMKQEGTFAEFTALKDGEPPEGRDDLVDTKCEEGVCMASVKLVDFFFVDAQPINVEGVVTLEEGNHRKLNLNLPVQTSSLRQERRKDERNLQDGEGDNEFELKVSLTQPCPNGEGTSTLSKIIKLFT